MYINVILNCYKDSFQEPKMIFDIFSAFRYTFSIISASFCSLRLQLRSAQLQSNVVHHNVAINAAEMLGMDIPICFHMAGDGHQPNGKGFPIYLINYKDSLLKVG